MESNVFDEIVVVKRSGQRVEFNGTKIAIAIKKAFDSVYEDGDEDSINKIYSIVLKYIEDNYSDRKTISVETIQDIIEYILKQENFLDVHNSFHNYRIKRSASREMFDKKQQHKFIKATEKLILTADEESTPIDLLFKFGKTTSNEFAKSYLIDSKYVRAHEDGKIYIHDLDYYVLGATFSSHLDLSYINNYNFYFEELLNILLNIKKEQCGDHSIPSIDYLFEPWLIYKYRDMFKENLFILLKSNGLYDYININQLNNIINKINTINVDISMFEKIVLNKQIEDIFDFVIKNTINKLKDILESKIEYLLKSLENSECILNNSSKYLISIGTNISNEGIFVRNAYFNVINKLDRLENVITVYKFSDNKIDDNIIDSLLNNKNISFSNINASYNKKYLGNNSYKSEVEYFSNGERILENIIDKNQVSVGRSIILKTTIDLVRIALKYSNIKDFYGELDNMLEFVKNQLIQSYEYISNKYKKSYKFSFNNILLESEKLDDENRIRKAIKNGVLDIGYAGLKEAIYIINKKSDNQIDNINMGIDIIKFMKEKCSKFSEENRLNFDIFENVDSDILKALESIDKSIFGNIDNVTDDIYEPFYTIFNKDIELNDRLKLESKIQKYSSGGYYNLIVVNKNISKKKLIEVIENILDNDIGYFKIRVGKLE